MRSIIFGCLLLTSRATGLQLLHATGGHRTSRLSAVANPEITAAKPVQAAAPPPKVFPCGDALDKKILALAGPAICNFLILPITQSVDLFFIGKLNSALASMQNGWKNPCAAGRTRVPQEEPAMLPACC